MATSTKMHYWTRPKRQPQSHCDKSLLTHAKYRIKLWCRSCYRTWSCSAKRHIEHGRAVPNDTQCCCYCGTNGGRYCASCSQRKIKTTSCWYVNKLWGLVKAHSNSQKALIDICPGFLRDLIYVSQVSSIYLFMLVSDFAASQRFYFAR